MSIYLDYNATTPIDAGVLDYMNSIYKNTFGNADSRTHIYGAEAKKIVELARGNLAELIKVDSSEIVFTSSATESSNIAILGLAEWGKKNGKTHIITSAIEHKATLEPIYYLEKKGFTADYITPEENGVIDEQKVLSKVNNNTLLISIQHVNNETGVIQPVKFIGDYCYSNKSCTCCQH